MDRKCYNERYSTRNIYWECQRHTMKDNFSTMDIKSTTPKKETKYLYHKKEKFKFPKPTVYIKLHWNMNNRNWISSFGRQEYVPRTEALEKSRS
ncbi:hypothetical protein SeMB42_g03569 [Synchytrium endobioticum]|uniref:Uncharacterized protein n=1 Tax=Synchytrium endobioticum TaxID=286115 RepID=A0A507D5A8_9FUNG|nr:hypothetical protein SeMB42_g03569 [Synchytrium endobioticum]